MRVSVYLPTKNRQKQLQRAVESVLNQTLQDFELIIVNDGSTDATPGYLDRLTRTDSRIRVVHNTHSLGAPTCRNSAIDIAQGEWVTGLDDDDEFMPRRLELLLEYAHFIDRSGERYCGVFSQELIRKANGSLPRSLKRGPVHLEDLLQSNAIGNQIFVRKSILLDAGGFDPSLPAWQDLELLLRLTHRFGPAQLLDVPLYIFDDTPRSDRISSQKKQRIIDTYKIVSVKHEYLSPRQRQQLYLQIFGSFYGFKMSAGDIWRYLKINSNLSGIASLVQTLIRQ